MGRHGDDDYGLDLPRRKPPRRKRGTRLAAPGPAVILLGLAGLFVLLSFTIRGAGLVLLWAGVALIVAGHLWFYLVALSDGIGQFLLCFLVPFYNLFYIISNWPETKHAFGLNLLGIFVALGCAIGGAVRDDGGAPRPVAMAPAEEESGVADLLGGLQPPKGAPALPAPDPKPPTPGPAPKPANPPRPLGVNPLAKKADKTVYLASLRPTAYRPGPWKYAVGFTGAEAEAPIKVNGRGYMWGMSACPPDTTADSCLISFALEGGYQRLKGWGGLNDYSFRPWGKIVFAVWGDGRKLWESEPLDSSGASVGFDIDIAGVKSVTLQTRVKEGSHLHAHAVWLDPWLER